ncbi:E3 ubiquitin-protein ligase SHPRH isoform X3 [Dermacentor silvarum]|uniref:E3 ubiquitin-protein ligase SHPRH isoform X3 n=1 Tax=Dermacentor silvarum TaxID=543639 RepID=UPI002100A316|nr:E3 ubiquitin-protein ligase SHPRH isoform X3 [Dermacentor silvarum]
MSSRRKATAPRRLGEQADNAAQCGQSFDAPPCLASGSFIIDESGDNDSCSPAPAKKRKSRSKKLLLDQELESLLEGCDYALQVERQDEHRNSIMFCLGQVQLTARPVSDGRRLEDTLKSSYRFFIGCNTEQTDCCVVYNCTDQWLCFNATLPIDEDVRLILSHRKSVLLVVANVVDSCIVLDVLLSPTNVYRLSHASDSPRNSVNWEMQALVHYFFGISHTSRHIETEKFRRQDFDLLYARIAAAQSLHPAADEDENAVQHAALRPTLRPYQKEVVRWMLKRERSLSEISVDNFLYMPLVDCYGKLLYYNKYAGFFVEKKMDFVATARPGGILADEMGLGKTVELLACILLHPMPTYDQTSAAASDTEEYELSDDDGRCAEDLAVLPVGIRVECLCGGLALGSDIEEVVRCPGCRAYHHLACTTSGGLRAGEKYLCPHCWVDPAKEKIRVKTTLIVSPSSIGFQWLEEIERHQKDDRLHVMEYQGVQSHGFVSPLTFANYDIVLTTYEVLKKELNFTDLPHANSTDGRSFRKPRKFLPTPCPLTALLWWRICLDEAQMVEGTATKAAQMALKLSAVNRWCVTGTPIQKNLHDMYGLLLFLGEEPYNVKLWWNECLLLPYCHGDTEPLVTVLSRCFKRTMKRNVLEQIGVPPQESIFHTLNFSPVEEVFYERQADRCASLFREQLCKFPDHSIRIEQLDRHSVGLLLQPLVRLRQACCHPRAVRGAFLPMRTEFNTAHGLQYVVDTQMRQLEAARENLLGAVKALSANPSADEVVSAVECHLRPSKKKRNKCNYCVVHELFNLYESRLFCFSEDAAHEEAQDKEDALFGALRRGNWGDSNLEKIIKSLSKSSSFAGDRALCSDGQVHVQLFAALKKEFRAMRAVYMNIRDFVGALDELEMATVRLEVHLPSEEVDKDAPPLPVNVLRPWEVPEQWSMLLYEKELHKNDLKKKLGQLFYLQNLEKAGSHRAGECNPEPCPICQNPLGTRWSVMQCGHNFCLDCIKMVCSTPSCMRSGSLLCAVCRSSCAHGDVFYVQTTPPSAPQSRFSLKGSHTTKIGGIVETILEIKADDPDAKALVFTSWSIVIDVLKKALEENEVSYITLKPGPNFKNNLALFRHDPSIMVLLLPLSLGAKGLNLTEATHVLLVEPILNLGEELQAIGRVHRIGQTRKTYIHRFMVKNTIEERIVDFLKSSQTSRSCLEDHAKMTIDDLKNLFK